jgi:hypothetical protein
MHETKHAEELPQSKIEFESFAAHYNVKVQNIHADNGVYAAKLFHNSCLKSQQSLIFCAVWAHWQNWIAERFISSIMQIVHTILLHAMAKWPSVPFTTQLPSITHPYAGTKTPHPSNFSLVKIANGSLTTSGVLAVQYLCLTKSYRTDTPFPSGMQGAGRAYTLATPHAMLPTFH